MPMRHDTWQPCDFIQAAIDEIGAKKVAAALGVGVQHVYRLGKPEESGGSRTDLDRLVHLIDVLGSHPAARPLLKQLRLYINCQFARVLDGEQLEPLTAASVFREGGMVLKEVSEFVAELDEPGRMDTRKVLREGHEALHAVELLVQRIMAMPMKETPRRRALAVA